jgi:Glycosyl transferase family 2
VISNRVNRGLHLRNLALRQARGAYIAFQNSDDIWRPGKLSAQVGHLAANPDCGACFTAVELCDEEGNPCPDDPVYGGLFRVEQHDRWQWLHRFYHTGNCLALPSAVVRASVLRQTGLMDPSLFLVGDWDLWVQIAAIADLHVLRDPLTVVRVRSHGRNLSAPTAAGQNRGSREAIEVLNRYARPPILGRIDRIFGAELEPASAADASSEPSALVRLGFMATSSEHRHHRLAGIEFLRLALRTSDLEGGLSQETRARAAHRLFLVSGELDAQTDPNKPVVAGWVQFTAQLFWRFESDLYSEEQSTRLDCVVSSSPVCLPLPFPMSGKRLGALRLDLANRPVRLLLHELTLYSAHREVLWRCPSTWPASFETVAMTCHQPDSGPGILIHTLDNDPQWILPLSPDVYAGLAGGGTLEIVVQLA